MVSAVWRFILFSVLLNPKRIYRPENLPSCRALAARLMATAMFRVFYMLSHAWPGLQSSSAAGAAAATQVQPRWRHLPPSEVGVRGPGTAAFEHVNTNKQLPPIDQLIDNLTPSLNGMAPSYLAAKLQCLLDMPSRRGLCVTGAATRQLHILDLCQSEWATVRDRTFAIASAQLWKSLPPDIVACDTLSQFHCDLFQQSYIVCRDLPFSFVVVLAVFYLGHIKNLFCNVMHKQINKLLCQHQFPLYTHWSSASLCPFSTLNKLRTVWTFALNTNR